MEEKRWESCNAAALLDESFSQDDLRQLALSTGELLGCPLMVLDDTFHGATHHLPLGFSDALFETAVRCGEITCEAGAIISKNAMLTAGWADYVQLADSPLSAAFCTSHQRGRAPRLPHLRGYGRTFGKDPAANLGAFVEMPLRRVKSLYVQDAMLLYSWKCFLSSWFFPSTSSVISASSTVSGEMFTSVLPFRFTPRMLTP